MIDECFLVNTSVWIGFLIKGNDLLATLLPEERVILHPIVLGELASGNLPNRRRTLNDLFALDHSPVATFSESLYFLEHNRLYGHGLHWNDIQISGSISDQRHTSLDP